MSVNYDSWKLASPYDYDEPTPADLGWVHKDNLPEMEAVEDFLQGIYEALYINGDVDKLEGCLEELFHQFNMKFELGEVQLVKKKTRDLMQWYLGYQRAHLDHLNHTGRGIQDYEPYTKEMNHG